MDFVKVVIAICLVLATMLLEISVNDVRFGADVFGVISNDSSKLLIR